MFCNQRFQCSDHDDCPKTHRCSWGLCYSIGKEKKSCYVKKLVNSNRFGVILPSTTPGEIPIWEEEDE